nr:YebC/PmpR family DNA-binding transcriptional regulator [Spirulina major]
MAGHSKWAKIKRQKARVDAKKGKTFTQLSRAIIVAARNGLPDPDGNMQLRTAIEKAKAAGIPNENIERAIAKGAGTYEAIRYEGYGPGGVAVLIEAFTDNRDRTAADLRVAFGENGGNLGETGCVSWMFDQKGVVCLAGVIEEETLLEVALAAEAESPLQQATALNCPFPCQTLGWGEAHSLSFMETDHDCTDSIAFYRQIPTLAEYVLIDATQIRCDRYTKNAASKWELTSYPDSDEDLEQCQLEFNRLEFRCDLGLIYEDVELSGICEKYPL